MSKVRSITPNDPADFTPELGNYKTLQPFRYWCQKVLPLVYDDSLSYYELLCKVVDYLNKTMEDVETLHGDVTNLHAAYEELQSYVNNYFSSLDVQEEINNKLDKMVNNGTFQTIFGGSVVLKKDISPFTVNNSGAISELFECANTYLQSNLLYYGNYYTAYDFRNGSPRNGVNEKGQFQIDCSSFVELVLRGCDFNGSRYNENNNRNFNTRMYSFSYYNKYNDEVNDHPPLRYTYQQAKFAKESGYSFYPNYDWTNVNPGDVIWLNEDVNTEITPINPLGVDHCIIYMGRHPSGDLLFFEAGGVTSNMVEVMAKNDVIKISRRKISFMLDRTKIIARFPLGYYNKTTYNLCQSINEITATDTMEYYPINTTIKKGELFTINYMYKSNIAPIIGADRGYLGYPSNKYFEKISFSMVASADFYAIGIKGDGCFFKKIEVYRGIALMPENTETKYLEQTDTDTQEILNNSYLNPIAFKSNSTEGICMSVNKHPYGVCVVNDLPCVFTKYGIEPIFLTKNYRSGTVQLLNEQTSINFSEPFSSYTVFCMPVGYPTFEIGVSDFTDNGFLISAKTENIGKYVNWLAIKRRS